VEEFKSIQIDAIAALPFKKLSNRRPLNTTKDVKTSTPLALTNQTKTKGYFMNNYPILTKFLLLLSYRTADNYGCFLLCLRK